MIKTRPLYRAIFVCALVGAVAPALRAASTTSSETKGETDILANLKFRNLGPSVGGGRVTAVVGIPGDPNIYYAGTAGGGIWKTTDAGDTWKAIFTKQATASIGALAVAPSNPNVIWACTGEANIRNDVIDGAGVYVSTDAGETWKQVGLTDAGQISSVIVDPKDSNNVFVGVLGHAWGPNPERGVFRTTDGGKTWEKVLYVDDDTGVSSLVMEPGNPEVLYAGMWEAERKPWTMINGGTTSGIYRTIDGGQTWTKLTRGLPTPPIGRIALAVAPSDPSHVYALIGSKTGMLWQSLDRGNHWGKVSNSHALDVRPFYFSRMAVSPTDENRVYFCSLFLMESNDGGRTAHPADRGVHVDHHAIWIDPTNGNRIIEGTDGGVFLSLDGAKNWHTFDNLPIEQFYSVSVATLYPYRVCGGLQDNGMWCGFLTNPGRGRLSGADWVMTGDGDGEYVVPAPSDPSIIYGDDQDGDISRLNFQTHHSTFIRPYLQDVDSAVPANLKYRFNWTSPIAVSRTDANTVYLGGNVLFKSTDGGKTWSVISPDLTRNDKSKQQVSGEPVNHDISGAETYDTILSITPAPTDPKVIWVGTDDGEVQVTRDGGNNWTNTTPNIPGAPAWAMVAQVGVSPFDAGTAYVAFDAHKLDDNRPYVYKTEDYGQTWQEITNGLPADASAIVVREDPDQRGLLVLGTMTGLYYSLDSGGQWMKLKSNFPTSPVFDLKFVRKPHDLVVATHGRGLFVWDDIRPLEQLAPSIEASDFHLFTSGPAVMRRRWAGTERGSSGLATPGAPDGVVIDYSLRSAIKSPGKKKSAAAAPAFAGAFGMAGGPSHGPVKIVITDSYGGTVAILHGPGKAGVNRVVWNMRYEGPARLKLGGPSAGGFFGFNFGPLVVPGDYHVAVTARGKTQSERVTVEPDPAVHASLADFRAQTQAALLARNEVSALNTMLNRLVSLQDQINNSRSAIQSTRQSASDPPLSAKYSSIVKQGQALAKQLHALEASVYQVKVQRNAPEDDLHYLTLLHGQISSLPFLVDGPYATPPDALVREDMSRLRGELNQALAKYNGLLRAEVANYNKSALAAGAPTLFTGGPISIAPVPSL